MNDCGCTAGPCSCADATAATHQAALSLGLSAGSLVARLSAMIGVGQGAAGRTHARNQALAGLGHPYVSIDGRLASAADPSGIPVGYGLDLDHGDPTFARSTTWRQTLIAVDRAGD